MTFFVGIILQSVWLQNQIVFDIHVLWGKMSKSIISVSKLPFVHFVFRVILFQGRKFKVSEIVQKSAVKCTY